MNALQRQRQSIVQYAQSWLAAWDWFWFTPCQPHLLAVIRIATGCMLLYSQLVVGLNLFAFLGDDAWINNQTIQSLHDGSYAPADMGRSYLWHLSSPTALIIHHLLTLAVTACFAIGFGTRLTAPLAWFLQLMLVHRMTGALFGLDQVMTMLTTYLMISPCGAVYSLDSKIRQRLIQRDALVPWQQWMFPDASPSVAANLALRLIQLHLCIVYLFGGLWKARGTAWWDGSAIWFAVSNAQYQSWDATWLSHYPRIFSMLAHITVFWEVFYCALIWPKLTRPICLAIAVAVHAGIAMFLGMITFGTIMIVANVAFLPPDLSTRRKAASQSGSI